MTQKKIGKNVHDNGVANERSEGIRGSPGAQLNSQAGKPVDSSTSNAHIGASPLLASRFGLSKQTSARSLGFTPNPGPSISTGPEQYMNRDFVNPAVKRPNVPERDPRLSPSSSVKSTPITGQPVPKNKANIPGMMGASTRNLQSEPRNGTDFRNTSSPGIGLSSNLTSIRQTNNTTILNTGQNGKIGVANTARQFGSPQGGITPNERRKWNGQGPGVSQNEQTKGFAPSNPIPQRNPLLQTRAATGNLSGFGGRPPALTSFKPQQATRDEGLFQTNDLRPSNPLPIRNTVINNINGAPRLLQNNRHQSQTAFRGGSNVFGIQTMSNAGQYGGVMQGVGGQRHAVSYARGMPLGKSRHAVSHASDYGRGAIHGPSRIHNPPAQHHKPHQGHETKAKEKSETAELRNLNEHLEDLKNELKEQNEHLKRKEEEEKSGGGDCIDQPDSTATHKREDGKPMDERSGGDDCIDPPTVDETEKKVDSTPGHEGLGGEPSPGSEGNPTGKPEDIDNPNGEDHQDRRSDYSEPHVQGQNDWQTGARAGAGVAGAGVAADGITNMEHSLSASEGHDTLFPDNGEDEGDDTTPHHDDEALNSPQDDELFDGEELLSPSLDHNDNNSMSDDKDFTSNEDLFGESDRGSSAAENEEQDDLFAEFEIEAEDEEVTGDLNNSFGDNEDQEGKEENDILAENEMGQGEAGDQTGEQNSDDFFENNGDGFLTEPDLGGEEFDTASDNGANFEGLFQDPNDGNSLSHENVGEGDEDMFNDMAADNGDFEDQPGSFADGFGENEESEDELGGLDDTFNENLEQDQDDMNGIIEPDADENTFDEEEEIQSLNLDDENGMEDPFEQEEENPHFDFNETNDGEDGENNLDYLDEDENENENPDQERSDADFEEDQELDDPFADNDFENDELGDNVSEVNDLDEDPAAEEDLDTTLEDGGYESDPATDDMSNNFEEGSENDDTQNEIEDAELEASNDFEDSVADDDIYGGQEDDIDTCGDFDDVVQNDNFQDDTGDAYGNDYDDSVVDNYEGGNVDDFGDYGGDGGMNYDGGETMDYRVGDMGYSGGGDDR